MLLVHNRYRTPGGEDAVFQAEVRLLRGRGHQVRVVETSSAEIGSPWHAWHAGFGIWSRGFRARIQTEIRDFRPDIAHFHNLHPLITPSVYYACSTQNVPVVQTLHNYRLLCPSATFYRQGRPCELCLAKGLAWPGVVHSCYRNSRLQSVAVASMLAIHRWAGTWQFRVDAYVALTEFARRKHIEGGLPADRIFVKPNFVDPDPGWKHGEGEFALFVGRLAPEKGIRTVLSAWRTIAPHVPLHIVGEGPLIGEVRDAAAAIGGVTVMGLSGHSTVLAEMKAARYLVFSSEWYEGFPLVLAEAFACGLPIVAARIGAASEIVVDGGTGVHFTAGDASDLAEKAAWAFNQPEACRSWGATARQEYETRYSAVKGYELLVGIYHRVLERTA